ncbi:SEC-C metal-binding domain-containing protein [Aromatoleum buckelii]|uniref:Uncharacterized protein n=1 Tax=Aromatoleum buckelii TaxID=200254 RepID=A0ABX1N764_9RHOO
MSRRKSVKTACPRKVLGEGALPPQNSLCPCGSGKRYKHCHGKLE